MSYLLIMDLLKGEKVIQLKLGPFNDPDLT